MKIEEILLHNWGGHQLTPVQYVYSHSLLTHLNRYSGLLLAMIVTGTFATLLGERGGDLTESGSGLAQ